MIDALNNPGFSELHLGSNEAHQFLMVEGVEDVELNKNVSKQKTRYYTLFVIPVEYLNIIAAKLHYGLEIVTYLTSKTATFPIYIYIEICMAV